MEEAKGSLSTLVTHSLTHLLAYLPGRRRLPLGVLTTSCFTAEWLLITGHSSTTNMIFGFSMFLTILWQEAMPWFQCEDVIQTYYISSFKLLFLIFYGLLGCTTFLMVQKSQPTIWHVCNPANDGMFFISTGQPEFFPSTLSFAEILKRPTHIKLRVDFHFWSPTTKKTIYQKISKVFHHCIISYSKRTWEPGWWCHLCFSFTTALVPRVEVEKNPDHPTNGRQNFPLLMVQCRRWSVLGNGYYISNFELDHFIS